MDETIRVLKALADSTRLRITLALSVKRRCVCELATALELPQPTVSRCLRVLRDAGVARAARSAQWTDYELNYGDPLVKAVVSAAGKALAKDPFYKEDTKRVLKANREKIRETK